jgi:hypothetical protein
LAIFSRKFRVFPFLSVFFGFFGFVSKKLVSVVSLLYQNRSFDVSIEPKQTEDPPKQFKREYIWVFFRKFWVVSVCFGLLRNRSVCFGCFDIGSKHQNKPKFFVFGFTKQTETDLVSVRTEIYFCLFRGHTHLWRGRLIYGRGTHLRSGRLVYRGETRLWRGRFAYGGEESSTEGKTLLRRGKLIPFDDGTNLLKVVQL